MGFGYFKSIFMLDNKNYRRLDFLVHACNLVNIPLEDLKNNIILYKTKRSKVIIKNPKIPIEVSPIFYMLVAHLMGDGGYIRFKHKKPV